MCDWASTIKQDVRFQVGMCPEKIQLHQILIGRPSAIINFTTPDISGKLYQIARALQQYKRKCVVLGRDIP